MTEEPDFNLKIKRLRRARWRVKIRKYLSDGEISDPMSANSQGILGDVYSFTATKKYVNIRGTRPPGNRHNGQPSYSLFCKNVRTGYDKRLASKDFNEVFNKAEDLLSQGEDNVIITKANLPAPIKILREKEIFEHTNRDHSELDIRVHCLYSFRFVGIVGITDQLIVTEVASINPHNDAWFAVRCYGVSGTINVITDGESFYATRVVSGKVVVDYDLSADENRKVVEKMSALDQSRLFRAASDYAQYLASNFA